MMSVGIDRECAAPKTEAPPEGCHETYDVIVAGSGAAALLAAVRAADAGARVIVLEKEAKFGGNSALSGGGIWVPNNSGLKEAGIRDSLEEAFAYLRSVIPADQISDETIRTYLQSAPQMIDYMRQIGVPYTPVQKYPDYYPDFPGWKPGGRTMDCAPLDARALGDFLPHLREMPPQSKAFDKINLTITEAAQIQAVASGWRMTAARALLRYWLDIRARLKGRRDRRLCMGEALVGRLFVALRMRGVELRLETAVTKLLRENDRVTGLVAQRSDGTTCRFTANKGVIIAAGGFERNASMRQANLADPTSPDWSAGSAGNTGDCIRAGRDVGAALGNMREAWWAPVVRWGNRTIPLFFEKSKPGLIIVDRNGRRFMNESITYNSYGQCMYGEDYHAGGRVPAFVIFDRRYRKKYMFAGLLQSALSPDWMNRSAFEEGGLLVRAGTLRDLAVRLGIDAEGLVATSHEMGHFSRSGTDEHFGRGGDEHDRMYGDESVTPNPCLGPVDNPPFYGARVYPGDIGTKGGLVIDGDARVLDEAGQPIPGLYAAGNSTASIMGDKYPGAGCTLGPALTMAFRAADHVVSYDARASDLEAAASIPRSRSPQQAAGPEEFRRRQC